MDIAGEGGLAINENAGEQRSNINISDVFEAISIADPSYAAGVVRAGPPGVAAAGAAATATATATTTATTTTEDAMYRAPPEHRPYVRIVEQPAAKALRFRYECEGRSAGSIPGANSTQENKTYPTIEIVGHKGRAVVVVSCVTKEEPYRPHPHNLVGRDLCKKGVCTVEVNSDNMQVSFSNLGIQCVKKKDIEEALRIREEMRVDPFKTGFKHKKEPSSIDLNAVRLCFQVFLEQGGKIRHALPPVVSDIIYDKKAMSDLVICRLSHCSAPVTGGQQVILLCEKVTKEDIAVTLFEKVGEQVTWQADADNVNVHKQVAICFNTPRYHNERVEHDVQAYIQLRRPSDNAVSEPVPFEFIRASAADPHYLKRKRQKPLTDLSQFAQPVSEQERNQPIPDYYKDFMNMSRDQKPIKLEPKADKTPPHQMSSPPLSNMMMYRNILGSPSPQHNLAASSPPLYAHDQYANWNIPMEIMHGGNNLTVPGPSHIGGPYSPQDMSVNWVQNVGHVSPNMGHVSPNMGQVSPNMGHVSPNLGQMSPNIGHVSPNVVQMANVPMVPTSSSMGQLVAGAMMETQIPEGWPEPGESMNLTELSGLSGLLDAAASDQLSDNLSRLNTGDLLQARSPL